MPRNCPPGDRVPACLGKANAVEARDKRHQVKTIATNVSQNDRETELLFPLAQAER